MTTLVLISDTHGIHDPARIPEGDILIHAGDISEAGELYEVAAFNEFLGSLPHRHKILIAGNHDFLFEQQPKEAQTEITNAIYLMDSSVETEGIKFYGSPWQPWFHDWAFNLQRGEELRRVWAKIPSDTDVLITHGPPAGIGDRVWTGENVGCEDLRDRVLSLRPRLHVFGHIHEARGIWHTEGITFVNASMLGSEEQAHVFHWDK